LLLPFGQVLHIWTLDQYLDICPVKVIHSPSVCQCIFEAA
jgi:hypothetical protein